MITFTLECVVGRPTSPGAEGRFSVKSNFYMRGGVVDGWWLVVGGMVCEGCRKCNHPPNKQRAEKKSHTLQKKMYCALGHFITPQKNSREALGFSTNQVFCLMGNHRAIATAFASRPHCDRCVACARYFMRKEL